MWNSGEFSINVSNGTFEGIHPGDYIVKTVTINGNTYENTKWLIAELDPYYMKRKNTNSSNDLITTHHVGIIPLTPILAARMNTTNTTSGGFKGSYMWTTILPMVLNGMINVFGDDHLLQFCTLITNLVKSDAISMGTGTWSGCSDGWEWVTTKITLMSENQVYGGRIWGGGYDTGEATKQLTCFKNSQKLMNFNGEAFWLRTVTSNTDFAFASGEASSGPASTVLNVRPLCLLY